MDQHVNGRDAGCGISKHVFSAANTSSTMEVFCVEADIVGVAFRQAVLACCS